MNEADWGGASRCGFSSLAGKFSRDSVVAALISQFLRQTFRTIGQAAEVPPLDIHILMSHSLPGVNAGYITLSGLMEDHLRRQQARISRAILQAVEAGRSKQRTAVLAWLRTSKVEALASADR